MLGKASILMLAAWRRIGSSLRTAHARKFALIGDKSRFSHEGGISSRRNREAIHIGANCHIRGELMVFRHGGSIRISDWVYIGPMSSVWSSSDDGVKIGKRVLISSNVHIHDTNGHPLDPKERFDQTVEILTRGHPKNIENILAGPIHIEDDVWIGLGAIILKGVTIGEGAIVGAGSVVRRSVAPYTVVAGNPARVVKELERPDV